jgi:hypothetical protein
MDAIRERYFQYYWTTLRQPIMFAALLTRLSQNSPCLSLDLSALALLR